MLQGSLDKRQVEPAQLRLKTIPVLNRRALKSIAPANQMQHQADLLAKRFRHGTNRTVLRGRLQRIAFQRNQAQALVAAGNTRPAALREMHKFQALHTEVEQAIQGADSAVAHYDARIRGLNAHLVAHTSGTANQAVYTPNADNIPEKQSYNKRGGRGH